MCSHIAQQKRTRKEMLRSQGTTLFPNLIAWNISSVLRTVDYLYSKTGSFVPNSGCFDFDAAHYSELKYQNNIMAFNVCIYTF